MAATSNNGSGPRLAPHDEGAEAALIGAMLLAYNAVDSAAERLTPDDFYRPSHGHIFEAILTLYEDGDPIDPVTVANVLKDRGLLDTIGGPAELVTLQARSTTTSSAPKYADVVARYAAQRRMLTSIEDAAAAIYSGQADTAINYLDRALAAASRAAGDGRAFRPIDIADLLAGTPHPPTMLTGWLYAGGLHILQSEPGVGKSWLALWQSLAVMREGGTVVYLDEEGGPTMVTERLRALGADIELIRARFRYFAFEGRSWDAADAAALESLLRTIEADNGDPRLAVLDSLPNFIAAAGADENSAGEVTAFVTRVYTPFRKYGTALLALDHLTKPAAGNQRGGKARSRYSRGSGAKLAMATATIHVEQQTEFTRSSSGRLHVWQAKDRDGALDLPSLSAKPRVVAVNVDGSTGRLTMFEREDDGTAPASDTEGLPTSCMELMSAWAARSATVEPKSQSEALEAVMGFRTTVRRKALDTLVEHGYLTVTKGPRGKLLYSFVRLFHADEPLGERVADERGVPLEMF